MQVPDAAQHPSLPDRLKHEAQRGLILFLYLWALLGLFVLNEDVVNRESGHTIALQGFAFLNALVFAKVMLVTEHMNVSGWLSSRARVFTIVFEAAFCTSLFLIVHSLERIMIGYLRGESLSARMPSIGGGGFWGVSVVALILFVSLLPFFTFKTVAGTIGGDRSRAILFRRPEPTAGV
jgi:hypothetical protein